MIQIVETAAGKKTFALALKERNYQWIFTKKQGNLRYCNGIICQL